MRAQTIYSVRNALGAEIWWTTSRKRAVERVTLLNGAGFIGDRYGPCYLTRLLRV